MNSSLLHYRLRPVVLRLRLVAWCQDLALAGAIAAALSATTAWGLAGNPAGKIAAWTVLAAGLGVGLWRTVVRWGAPADYDAAARVIEARHPELKGLLKTAVQQCPDAEGRFHFLQQHVIDDAITHGVRHPWDRCVPAWRLAGWMTGPLIALVLMVSAFRLSLSTSTRTSQSVAGMGPKPLFSGVEVTPGDAVMERGSSLVVLARFGKAPAQGAELVVSSSGEAERRSTLVRSLADPVFGGRVAELTKDLTYRVEYAGSRTRNFTVKLYDLPRLDRADVRVEFPEYTRMPVKEVRDTRRLSAVEGSRMTWQFHLNKPVQSAVLMARGKATNRIELAALANSATLTWSNAVLATNVTYELRLTDSDGRTNKVPAQLVLEALPNRVPELKLASPRGDLHPSPLEEIPFEGTIWDDFGVAAFGIAVTRPGAETAFLELGRDVPGREKRSFRHVLRLEEYGVKPDQLIAWFTWMDDIGPDGVLRRTTGDLYFAEVRPFDEVFREAQGGGGEGGDAESGGGGGEGRDPGGKLAELQKQIINATWKLQRDRGSKPGATGGSSKTSGSSAPAATPRSSQNAPGALREFRSLMLPMKAGVFAQTAPGSDSDSAPAPRRPTRRPGTRGATNETTTGGGAAALPRGGTGRFEDDLKAVRDGAEQALQQARESMDQAQSPESRKLWQSAIAAMEKSLASLDDSLKSPQALAEALVQEQAAYQTLLQLRARETEVTRGRNRSRGQGQGGAANQRQIDQLDLNQSENRYETQRSAASQQTAERKTQLQVLSRLQELARRQQDVNERLKELQASLQEARSTEERAELQRRLKRLEEEQRQMLSDMDEVQQRMNRPEAQSQLAQSRQELEQAREDLQNAAQATSDGRVSQALASGRRSGERLEKMRDDLRKESSSAFSEELKQLRNETRDLQRREAEIANQLRNLGQADTKAKRLTDSSGPSEALMRQLAEQKRSLTNVVNRATQISEQSETSEPLLSRQLYDTLRTFQQNDPGSVSRVQEQLLQSGELTRGLNDRLQEISGRDGARAVEATEELVRQGLGARAGVAEQEARKGIDALKTGIERAASRVLGDDTEALRLAAEELDALSGELEREVKDARRREPGQGGETAAAQPGRDGKGADADSKSGQGEPREPGDSQGTGEAAGASTGTEPRDPSAARNGRQGAGRDRDQAQAGGRPSTSPGESPGQSPGDDQAQGQGQGQGRGRGQQGQSNAGQTAGGGRAGEGDRTGEPQAQPGQAGRGGRRGGANGTNRGEGGDAAGLDLGNFAGSDSERGGGGRGGGGGGYVGPLTGNDFAPWADRLRDAEDLVDVPELRSDLARARERARLARLEWRREGKKPDWAVVELQVLKPLVEVRRQIREELGRRNTQDPLAPVDRDAVPTRFAEQVRRYYETLGRDSKGSEAKAGDAVKGRNP
jgi:hypothetical protein